MNYTPYILGVGALAAVGFIFKDDIKKLLKKGEEPLPEPEITPTPTPVINGGGGGGGGGAVSSGITPGFNPIGTPKEQLNFDQYYNFGDKGQEVAKMQQILNRIASITKKAPQITEDGNYGIGTQTRLKQLFTDTSRINLYKMYAALFAIYYDNWYHNGKNKNWSKNYDDSIKIPVMYAYFKNFYFNGEGSASKPKPI